MKRFLSATIVLSFFLVGCMPTRIVTVSPSTAFSGRNSTVVINQKTRTATTTTQVYPSNHDISLDLDLQAIGAAFAQSANVREFETLINNNSYMISNLDLNGDGYVDYLRVVEVYEGNNHLFVIQAVLGQDLFQDVATVVVENPHLVTYNIEIIGAPYIYGPNFYLHPVYYTHPAILAHLCVPGYVPWHSPWHWGNFPPHYHHPAPVFLNHYQAYVRTYMTNHRYCHEVRYPDVCHFRDYDRMCRSVQCNGYGKAHPERSFTVRNADVPPSNSAVERSSRAVNARDVRAHYESSTNTSTSNIRSSQTSSRSTASPSASQRSSSGTTSSAARNTSRSTSTGANTSSSRSAATSNSSTVKSGNPQTTVRSNVRSSGSSSTRTSTTAPNGSTTTVRRGSSSDTRATNTRSTNSTATKSSSSVRSSSSAGSTRSSSSSSSRSSGASGSYRR